jgi:hypothetical protein
VLVAAKQGCSAALLGEDRLTRNYRAQSKVPIELRSCELLRPATCCCGAGAGVGAIGSGSSSGASCCFCGCCCCCCVAQRRAICCWRPRVACLLSMGARTACQLLACLFKGPPKTKPVTPVVGGQRPKKDQGQVCGPKLEERGGGRPNRVVQPARMPLPVSREQGFEL